MKTVNKLLLIIFIICFVISCNNKTNSVSEIDIDSDKLIYKLEILDYKSDTTLYKTDNHNKCEVMVSKNIYVLDKCFEGDFKNKNEAIKFCEDNKKKIKSLYDVRLETTVSIKTNKNTFKEFCIWYDPILLALNQEVGNKKTTSYGIREGKIKLETGWVHEKDEVRTCLKIIFDEPNLEGGYKQNILNFARKGVKWELIKRERINTVVNDVNKEKMGYCYDTINVNCETKFNDSEVIYITNEMMFDLKEPICLLNDN
jgi:hypothetical protein